MLQSILRILEREGEQRHMLEMLFKVNRVLRNIVLMIGAVLVVLKITEKRETEIKTSEEGFQIREFDDIW